MTEKEDLEGEESIQTMVDRAFGRMTLSQREISESSLRMMCITYNMKGRVFNRSQKGINQMDDLFQKDNAYHDIYVFATQEAERSIFGNLINEEKEVLMSQLRTYFNIESRLTVSELRYTTKSNERSETFKVDDNQEEGDKFIIVEEVNLAATSLVIIVRKKLIPHISNIEIKKMPIGFFNKLANKGAISISMYIKGKRFLFLNCHLCAHEGHR